NFDIEAAAALDVIALERAVGESLRQVAPFRKALVNQRLIPMAGGVRSAVLRATRIVIFYLPVIAARLAKIDRIREVCALLFGDFADVVFLFVGLDVFPGGFDFFMVSDAKTIVIVKTFFRRIPTAFVNDQAPVGIWMLERGFGRFLLDDFHRQ